MRILVLTNDVYLKRKIELELGDENEIYNSSEQGSFDALIYDADSGIDKPNGEFKALVLTRNEKIENAHVLPLSIGAVKKLLSEANTSPLILYPETKTAELFKKSIKLTAHEYALLDLLYRGGTSFTSREKISEEVWQGAADGLINIYIHYLREKLETAGEKIIISSRKHGYKINPNYLGLSTEREESVL